MRPNVRAALIERLAHDREMLEKWRYELRTLDAHRSEIQGRVANFERSVRDIEDALREEVVPG